MVLKGIDTVSGYIPGINPTITDEVRNNITQYNIKPSKDKTYVFINPNRDSFGGEKLITRYSGFVLKMQQILNELGADLNEFDVIRADFCINSVDDTYNEYQKLHRLLISCLAKAYKYKNCYVSCDLWDWQKLSIAIKKDDSEVENYNKKRQSMGKDESANRLELRSKRMSGSSIEYQFMCKWFERLDKAFECFDEVQKIQNDHLEKIYKEDLARRKELKKICKFASLNEFLRYYKECIYTRKQLIDLVSRFDEVKNPVNKAKKFKERNEIEFFSKKDLAVIIQTLKDKTKEYFES